MNKLLVSNIINLDSGYYNLEFNTKKATLNIIGNVYIYILNSNIEEIIINLEDNSTLNVYKYDELLKNNVIIKINENNNTEVNFNGTYISEKDILLQVDNYIKGNNNKSNIFIRCISNKDYSKLIINVDIEKDTINNIALEDLKGINNGGFISIEPNIKCASNEVIANHLTTIGILDKESINYLMSKGISEDKAKEILLKGFINSNLDKFMKNLLGGE